MKFYFFVLSAAVVVSGTLLAGGNPIRSLASSPPPSSASCPASPAALCSGFTEDQAKLDAKLAEVKNNFTRTAHAESLIPRELRKSNKNGRSARAFGLLEQEVYKTTGLSRSSIQERFDLVQDTLLQLIQSKQLPQSWRTDMIKRVSEVKLYMPSEVDMDSIEACGSDGLSINAFAYTKKPGIVVCPAVAVQASLHPQQHSFDYILGHELGHRIDSKTLLQFDGELAVPYFQYFRCLDQVLGLSLRMDQMMETSADYWGAEVFAKIHRGESAQDVAKALSASVHVFCEDIALNPNEPVEWKDVHLPANARMSQTFIFQPAMRELLGCHRFTLENPGCDLYGIYPKR